MASKGVNIRDLPQILSPDYAQAISNYIIHTTGQLEKRKGMTELFTTSALPKLLDMYTDDLIVVSYGTTTAIYRISTDTLTVVKNDWSAGEQFGLRYGDYFFVCNGIEKIFRISQTLAYDAQTANFTVGSVLTGGTSGATATILQDADSGATGTLTLGNIQGTFADNETITDVAGGSATVNGTLTFTATELTNSVPVKVMSAISGRIYANPTRDETEIIYSEKDDGTNPPFNGVWTVGTGALDPGSVSFRNAGTVRAIVGLGQYIIVFSDFGKWAFYQDIIDSAGTLTKVDNVILNKLDLGGARGAKNTEEGIFYVNEGGLWQMMSLGQQDVPFSEQEQLTTVLLGSEYFEDIDLSNADIVYDTLRRLVLVTCAKDSSTNNHILVYNLDTKGMSFFGGWNLTNFLSFQNTIYGASSTDAKILTLFSGNDDDGQPISTLYRQEISGLPLDMRSIVKRLYIQGFLSPSSEITVHIDIYRQDGTVLLDAAQFTWSAQHSNSVYDEWGSAGWGTSSWGGDEELAGLVECFDGCSPMIRNAQRVGLRLTESSALPHRINWVRMYVEPKVLIRRRKMERITT